MSEGDLQFNREVLGKEYTLGTFKVTKEVILDFARAVGETNPLYTDEKAAAEGPYGSLVAPPTMAVVFVGGGEEPPDLELKFDGVSYAAGHRVEPRAPIRPGDILTCTGKVTDVYQKTGRSGTMAFVVVENTFVNQRGEVASVVGFSMAYRK
ncbi:MAG: MaoC family dehydratase N-terminal domain-containing protein [Dehalococcoidia bacterium]